MGFLPSRLVSLFDGSSAQSSMFTTEAQLVSDFDNLTVSWLTDTADASRFTVQGTNRAGLSGTSVTEADWSDVTGITGDGIFTIDPGVRWLRAVRNSNESLSIANLQLRA